MEYLITADRPFEETEDHTIYALEHHGFVVHRTFSLRSAAGSGRDDAGPSLGYSVLMLYAPGDGQQPLGLATLYGWRGRTFLHFAPTSASSGRGPSPPAILDVEAELAVALSLGGLDFCICATAGGRCVDPGQTGNGHNCTVNQE